MGDVLIKHFLSAWVVTRVTESSEALGSLAAQHLLERGHRRLCLVRPDDPTHTSQDVAFLQRLEGMRAAIGKQADVTLGLPLSEELMQPLLPRLIQRGST